MSERRYLRSDVAARPLVLGWSAWHQIVAPATAALHVSERHLKILKSFVRAPQAHAAALANPALRGGPFLDLAPERRGEVAALIEKTEAAQRDLIELAAALRGLQTLLEQADGRSLEPLYARVPARLRGYVELSYDARHRPGFRLFEPLLYASDYYHSQDQSIVLERLHGDGARPFSFSTPAFPDPSRLECRVPFHAPAIDRLSAARRTPTSVEDLEDSLGLRAHELDVFFTDEAPPSPPARRARAALRYFGHACVLVETPSASVLFDPFVSYVYPTELTRLTHHDLPGRIDCIVLTHGHADHTQLETLLALRPFVDRVIVPRSSRGNLEDPSLELMLRRVGFAHVTAVPELVPVELAPGLYLTALPFMGEHADLDVRAKMAVHLDVGGQRIGWFADSRNVEPEIYRNVERLLGPLDVMFIGMECEGAPLSWLYGPLVHPPPDRAMDQSRRLDGSNADMAFELIERFRAKQVFVYAMGLEPWLGHVTGAAWGPESKPMIESDLLIRRCRAAGIPAERLFAEKELSL